MRVYLGCTVRGDRSAVEGLRLLARELEAAGHELLTKHLLEDTVESAEARLSEREVYERDLQWLESSDLVVAEASGSSYGVGFEVGYVLGRSDQTGQRVVLLYREDRRNAISRLIAGNSHPRCVVVPYSDPKTLASRIRSLIPDL